ncbi:protein obstructor-E [Musca autumnalis]|uniref:protein obstructor-E n=1 Tax=Musca autumnalis TaxID=221902 RepID=UPI003CEE8008
MSGKVEQDDRIYVRQEVKFIIFTFILLVTFLSWTQADDVNVCSGVADNIFLPVLGNCSQYYVCMDETPVKRSCAEGYLFDSRIQSCTLPDEAQCVQNCTTALSSFCYDRTCTKYVLCYAGTAVVRECCDGLQYNAETDRCDFPQYVDCVDNMCTIFNDPTNITFLPSKAYCDKYYVCVDGQANPRNCSSGLQFNTQCNCCDFPSKANCTITSLQRNIKPFSKSPPKAADIKCPSEGSHFFPHILNPAKYYFCLNGRGVILECTPGLVYDRSLQTCREPANVGKSNLYRIARN